MPPFTDLKRGQICTEKGANLHLPIIRINHVRTMRGAQARPQGLKTPFWFETQSGLSRPSEVAAETRFPRSRPGC